MIRGPNQEQFKAIDHLGGVLLSAGAGSGKTFVLVEHFVHQLNLLKESNNDSELKDFLSKQVYITFTRKAAGELKERIEKRIHQQKLLDNSYESFWDNVANNLDLSYIGTIHGFCYALIQNGAFSDFISAKSITNEVLREKKIELMIDSIFLAKDIQFTKAIERYLSVHKKNLYETLKMVLLDPELRISWSGFDINQFYSRDQKVYENEYFSKLMKLNNLEKLFDRNSWNLTAPEKEAKWFSFYLEWQAIISHDLDWQGLDSFLAQRSPTPRNLDENDPIKVFFTHISGLKEFWKKYKDSFLQGQRVSSESKEILSAVKVIFDHLSNQLHQEDSLTFSDIEFYTYAALQRNSIAAAVHQNLNYIVVDEFQDTSRIQFEILQILTNFDYKKLFCVGDVKQAIYGFRGGTLTVFEECSRKIPQKLDMVTNYRSKDLVVNFNNHLFKHLFSLGLDYEEVKSFNVEVLAQIPFQKAENADGVFRYETLIEPAERKYRSEDLMEIEADTIFQIIMENIHSNDASDICVLYKNLRPSRFLLYRLIESGVSFKTQIKLNGDENPHFFLTKSIIEFLYATENLDERKIKNTKNYCKFLFEEIYKILGHDFSPKKFDESLDTLQSDYKLFGKNEALSVFFQRIGFASVQIRDVLAILREIDEDRGISLEILLESLERFSSSPMAYELKFGSGKAGLRIMTAHASKGLEFETVILGGIHNNGRSRRGDESFLGQLPGSLKLKLDLAKSDSVYTLEYIYERELQTRKEFAESNRLFYVACTRAISKLIWVDLKTQEKQLSIQADAWINGLRHWFENAPNAEKMISSKTINFNLEAQSKIYKYDEPIIFKNELGILINSVDDVNQAQIMTLPEVSVTKLLKINKCPRLFYLKSICKIDVGLLGLENKKFPSEKIKQHDLDIESANSDSELENKIVSSAERGITYHAIAEKMVKGNLVPPIELLGKSNYKNFEWLGKILSDRKASFEFRSEEEIKFTVSGFMISGIPDLILYPKDNNESIEVWDFKTGRSNEEKNADYYEQLIFYAHACFQSNPEYKSDKINLVLCFIDEMKTYHQIINKLEVGTFVNQTWEKLTKLDSINPKYCTKCEYNSLCNFIHS